METYFAEIVDGVVARVLVVEPEEVAHLPGEWQQTWQDAGDAPEKGRRYAGIGDTFNKATGAFIKPQPHPEWVLNEKQAWVAPVSAPKDGQPRKVCNKLNNPRQRCGEGNNDESRGTAA